GLAQTVVEPLDESVEFRVVGRYSSKVFLAPGERQAGLKLLADSQGRACLGLPTEEREGACLHCIGPRVLRIRRRRPLALLEGLAVLTQHHVGMANPGVPDGAQGVPRAQPERAVEVGQRLLRAPTHDPIYADRPMRHCVVWVQRYRSLVLRERPVEVTLPP